MEEDNDEIIRLNGELTKYLQDSFETVSSSLSKSKFKKTTRALLSYIPRGGYINNSILDCYLNNNAYTAGILFRSMIEHTFRHLYIYTRALNEDSDLVGEDYYGKLKGCEDLESLEKINNYNKVVYPDKTEWNLKGEHNQLIRDVGKKFSISHIFYYLINNFPKDKPLIVNGINEYLLARIQQYTQFSSNVHGGAYAEMVFEELVKDRKTLKKQLRNLTRESFQLYKSIVETTYLFSYIMDGNMEDYYKNISNIGK